MTGHDGDREVLKNLAKYGSDLSKPHHIIIYFYFRSERIARGVGELLMRDGCFKVDVHPAPADDRTKPPSPPQWSCVAEIQVVPSEQAIFRMTDRYERLAAQFHGEYDGWEADIVPKLHA